MTSAAAVDRCLACDAVLAPWELGGCACQGQVSRRLPDVLYAVACRTNEPLHARDFVRHAREDHRTYLDEATAVAYLAPDHRFCWAGRGVYGLYRHGPVPGPHNLEQVARVLLVAAGRPLLPDLLDFCMKQFGYRYNVASLNNAVARSLDIRWRAGGWDHERGDAAQLSLRLELRIVPERQRSAWGDLRDAIGLHVEAIIADRAARLEALGDPARFGLNWEH